MKKSIYILIFSLTIVLSNIYSQDFSKIKIGNINSKYAKPKNIINDNSNYYGGFVSNTRFIAYELESPGQYPYNEIGILKIDVNSNITIYNSLISFDGNQFYETSIVDMEVYMDKLYLLVSVDYNDFIIITIDKLTGSILKKEYVDVTDSNHIFRPRDLQISIFAPLNSPIVGVLGEFSTFYSSQSSLCLLYQIGMNNPFTKVNFNYYGWFGYSRDSKITHLDAQGVSIISNVSGKGLTFDYNFNTQLVSSAKTYSIGNTSFLFFAQTTIDGIVKYYGQLHYPNSWYQPGQSSDIFIITPQSGVNSTYLETYNNPNFIGFKGDDHSNGKDALYVNSSILFGGYYIKNDQNIKPYYGIVKIDFSAANPTQYITGKAYQLSTKARDFVYDPSTGVYDRFEEFHHSLTHNNGYYNSSVNPGAVFERRYVAWAWVEKNYIYYSNSLTSSSCNETIAFARTFDKTLIETNEAIAIENITTATINDVFLYAQYLSPSPHLAVCEETSSIIEGQTPRGDVFFNNTNKPYSNNVKINSELSQTSKGEEIKVFPNPIGNANQLTFSSSIEMSTIEIYDITNRKIYEMKNVNSKIVHIQIRATLTPGIYISIIRDSKGKLHTSKFLKK